MTELLPPPQADGRRSARDDDTVDLLALFGILRRSKWLVLALATAGGLAGLLLGLQGTPEYTAEAILAVEPHENPLADDRGASSGLAKDEAALATQLKMLGSRTHVARVMADLALYDDPEFNSALRKSEGDDVSAGGSLGKLLTVLPDSWLVATGLAEVVKPAQPEEGAAPELQRQKAVDAIQRRLEVTHDEGTYAIAVAFTSVDPAKAARIANRTAELYVQSQIDAKSTDIGETARWLREQIKALREEVRTAEAAVERFRAQNDLLDSEGIDLSEQELSEVHKELVIARADLAAKRARLQQLEDFRRRGQLDAVAEVVASPVIISLRQQETQLLRREGELAQEYGERHPLRQQLAVEQTNLASRISQEIDRIVRSLENEVQVIAARVQALEGELADSKVTHTGDREAAVQLRELQREAEATRSLYETLLGRFAEIGARQNFIRPDVRVISVAERPDQPSSPGVVPFAAAGFTVCFIFGGLLALLRERLDKSLRGAREVRAALGLPVLALVPKLGQIKQYRKPHRYLAAKPLSIYCESIRSVYTALRLGNGNGQSPDSVLVTSALPGEGKTTFAVSLAVFAASAGHRTLLVDFDLRHQRVAEELGLPSVGWLESGGHARHLTEMVQRDPETGVDVLLVAGHPTEPTGFFDRPERIADLLARLGSQYDLVILDSAPAIVASETRVAALHADRVIYVVRWGETPEGIARDGLQALKEAGANVVGTVITMVDLRRHAQYGYEDAAHYYGKYSDYGKYYTA